MTAKVALIYSYILGEHLKCLYNAYFILELNIGKIFWHKWNQNYKKFHTEN